MNCEELILNQVLDSIRCKSEAVTFVSGEVKASLNGSYEAKYFARKSQIEINDEFVEETRYEKRSPQAILTRLLGELTSTRDAVFVRLKVVDMVMRRYELGKYHSSLRKSKIRKICENRKIDNLVHFTKMKNIPGVLNIGLMSKDYMKQIGQDFSFNDKDRVDGKLNSISVSISFPNYKMFYKYRMKELTEKWAVIILSPSILWEEDCLFSKHNAADRRIRSISDRLGSPADLEEMFSENEKLCSSGLRKCDPIDPQAEVLVFNNIDSCNIKKIIVENEDDVFLVKKSSSVDVPVISDSRYFQSRSYSLKSF